MAVSKISVFVAFVVSLALVLPSQAQDSQQDYLDAHNTARTAVNESSLTWDSALSLQAQLYLGRVVGRCNVNVDLSSVGLNVKVGDSNLTGLSAVNSWASEKAYYNHTTNLCIGGVCYHYTQVVWSSSVTVGRSRAQCLNGLWIVACRYNPLGNIPGLRPY